MNPSPRQIAKLPDHSSFFAEGTLVKHERVEREEPYYPGSQNKRTVRRALVEIDSDSGHTYKAEVFEYPLRYEKDGALENMAEAAAEIGEGIRVKVYVVIDDDLRKRPVIGHGRATLLVPSAERQRAYSDLRSQISDQLAELQMYVSEGKTPDDLREARRIFATIRKLAYTKAEYKEARALIGKMPERERPIYDGRSTYIRDALEKAFGVNIETFNAEEYLVFANKVFFGEIPNSPDRGDPTYLFKLLEKRPFTEKEFFGTLVKTLRFRIEQLEHVEDDRSDERWNHHWLVTQCIQHLGRASRPEAVQELASLIEYGLERKFFDTRFRPNEPFEARYGVRSLVEDLIKALTEGVEHYGLRAPVGFDSGRVLQWNSTLAAYPYMDHVALQLRASVRTLFSN